MFDKKYIPNKNIRRHIVIGMALSLFNSCKDVLVVQDTTYPYTPMTASFLRNYTGWYGRYSQPFYSPTKSEKIKNTIMRKRLCKK